MSWIILRNLKSGGEVCIAITNEGRPTYTETPEDAVKFSLQGDARKYMNHCQEELKTYEGQEEWKVKEL